MQLEDMLKLKEGADTADAVEVAAAAIAGMVDDCKRQAVDLRRQRKGALLSFSAKKLRALEDEARELDITAEQGTEVVAALRAQLPKMRAQEAARALEDRVLSLNEEQQKLRDKFNSEWPDLTDRLMVLVDECRTHCRRVSDCNHEILDYNERFANTDRRRAVVIDDRGTFYADTGEPVPPRYAPFVSQVWSTAELATIVARVALPEPQGNRMKYLGEHLEMHGGVPRADLSSGVAAALGAERRERAAAEAAGPASGGGNPQPSQGWDRAMQQAQGVAAHGR